MQSLLCHCWCHPSEKTNDSKIAITNMIYHNTTQHTTTQHNTPHHKHNTTPHIKYVKTSGNQAYIHFLMYNRRALYYSSISPLFRCQPGQRCIYNILVDVYPIQILNRTESFDNKRCQPSKKKSLRPKLNVKK
jgi:dihydroorotase